MFSDVMNPLLINKQSRILRTYCQDPLEFDISAVNCRQFPIQEISVRFINKRCVAKTDYFISTNIFIFTFAVSYNFMVVHVSNNKLYHTTASAPIV